MNEIKVYDRIQFVCFTYKKQKLSQKIQRKLT